MAIVRILIGDVRLGCTIERVFASNEKPGRRPHPAGFPIQGHPTAKGLIRTKRGLLNDRGALEHSAQLSSGLARRDAVSHIRLDDGLPIRVPS